MSQLKKLWWTRATASPAADTVLVAMATVTVTRVGKAATAAQISTGALARASTVMDAVPVVTTPQTQDGSALAITMVTMEPSVKQ